jgi:hypothetical protein
VYWKGRVEREDIPDDGVVSLVKNDRRWNMKYKNKNSMGHTEVYVPKSELKLFYSILYTRRGWWKLNQLIHVRARLRWTLQVEVENVE